jgi:RimJ/RimL family protein N-acetyltransferase
MTDPEHPHGALEDGLMAVTNRPGYAILPQYRGRGLATEAAAAVLDWAERHEVDVYASVRPPNPASVRVLAKIGMRLVDSYVDEDGQRDIYRRQSPAS